MIQSFLIYNEKKKKKKRNNNNKTLYLYIGMDLY